MIGPGRVAAFVAMTLAVLLSGCADTPPPPDNRVSDFASSVTVQKDGTFSVIETIAIKGGSGLTRDLPATETGDLGNRGRLEFHIASVERDGQPQQFTTEPHDNGLRVQVAGSDEEGPRTYKLTYTTNRQVGSFADYDEFYWDATGNGWAIPIDHASVNVRLPDGAWIRRVFFATGPQGIAGKNANVTRDGDNLARVETTAPLQPQEGLTVSASFDKGAVQ